MKKAAAIEALKFVKPGMNIGLGTGSTANYFIEALGAKVNEGLDVKGVATSKATEDLAREHGIPLVRLHDYPHLDLTVDGADEFDSEFRLIKGGGGALLREKIVASSSRFMVVVADESKQVKKLGKFPLPVEVLVFGSKATVWKVERAFKILKLDVAINVRKTKTGELFVTENGNSGPGPQLTKVGARLPRQAIARTLINPTPPMPTYSKLRQQDPKQFNQLVEFLSSLK